MTSTDKITVTLTPRAARFFRLFLMRLRGSPNGPRGEIVDSVLSQIPESYERESYGLAHIHTYFREMMPTFPPLADSWPDSLTPFPKSSPNQPESTPAFWLVWREGSGNWAHKHLTEESAEREAERLAVKHPSARFYIAPISRFARCEITPVKWETADNAVDHSNDGVPF